MDTVIGKVIEVFIPEEYKNGNEIDIMNVNKIGFKVETDEKIYEVIQEQDDINCNILKGDKVLITKETIDGQEFIDIERYTGDEYE